MAGTRDSRAIVLVTTGTCCVRASSARALQYHSGDAAPASTVPTILFCPDRGPGLQKWDTKDPGNSHLAVPGTRLLP